jgi:hypothetical protein
MRAAAMEPRGTGQNIHYSAPRIRHPHSATAARNGGSACGYQEFSTPLAIPATAVQAGGQAVCLCIASAGRERPDLPLRHEVAPCE